MKTAEEEHKKYKKATIATTQTKKTTPIKQEKIPEWFNKKIEKQTATIEEQAEMQDLLKDYR
jgi:replication initiation and membrane attachment protein DnaB